MKFLLILLFVIPQFSYGQGSSKVKKLLGRALEFEQKGNIEGAIKLHKKVLGIDHGSYQSANTIAGLYGQIGKFSDEIPWAQKAIKINPKYSMGYINLGNGYFGNGDVKNAELCYKKADSLDSQGPYAPYSLGVIEEKKGNFKAAISYYEQSISRDPNFENGYYNLAAAYANIKDYKNANKSILKVLELNPNAKDAQELHEHIILEILRH